MKKRGSKGRRNVKKTDADLDGDVDNYEPSGSDDGLDENNRILLSTARGRRVKEGEDEVLKVYSSEDDDDEDDEDGVEEEEEGDDDDHSSDEKELYGGGVGSDMDSDIEGKGEDDGLPDSKAWGAERSQYYNTDYVDQDYLGFDNEEAANEEEKEADIIQRRMLAHLEGTDFTLGLLDTVEDKKKEAAKKSEDPQFELDEEKVEVDLSKLSKEEFIELMKRKNPEMFPIIEKCKERMKYLEEKVTPILELVDTNVLKRSKVIDYLEKMHQLILQYIPDPSRGLSGFTSLDINIFPAQLLSYSVNVLFYIHLKEVKVSTSNHAVLKRLNGLDHLLVELEVLRKKVDPEIDLVLEKAANGEDISAEEAPPPAEPQLKNRQEKRKRKLDLLQKREEYNKQVAMEKSKLVKAQKLGKLEEPIVKKAKREEKVVLYSEEESDEEHIDEEMEENEVKGDEDGKEKRKVSFAMLKNKGLTPRRKKENRNPRVKHRNKFKKAVIRRKGQVRQPRKEIQKYGGETSGINALVSKSIRIK